MQQNNEESVQIEELIEKVAATTANKWFQKFKAEQKKEHDSLYDRRLYNTKLLLEHYRLFKEHAENAIFDLNEIDDEEISAIEIMDSMLQTNVCKGEIAVESIKNSALRTKIIIEHIDDMLSIYENICKKSNKQEAVRKWDVIYTIFIAELPEGKNKMEMYEDLADKYMVSERQIRRDVNSAISTLTTLFFGVDGVEKLNKDK